MSDRLWAPWRIDYILGAKTDACFLCTYPLEPARAEEQGVLLVREHAFVCLNKYPFAAGHLLVAPRKHTSSLDDLTPDEFHGTMSLLRETARRLNKAVSPQGMNIGFNLGKAAGAGLDEASSRSHRPALDGGLQLHARHRRRSRDARILA